MPGCLGGHQAFADARPVAAGGRQNSVGAPLADLPLISIITPSLNQGRFIEQTILSVRNQDYPRLEHIVIDGGSSDETLEILRRYPDVAWISEPDAGQSDATNKGFARAKGDILTWLNTDDTYKPGAVSAAVEFLRTHADVDLVYGDCDEVDQDGRFIRPLKGRPFDLRGLLLLEYDIPQPATFFRRRVVELAGGLDTTFEVVMDFEYWVRVARVCRLEHSGQIWATFRVHAGAKTSARIREALPEHLATLDRVFGDPTTPRRLLRERRKAYSNTYLAGGVRSYESGAFDEARRRLWASLCAYWWPRPKALKALLLFVDASLGIRIGQNVVDRLRRLKRIGH